MYSTGSTRQEHRNHATIHTRAHAGASAKIAHDAHSLRVGECHHDRTDPAARVRRNGGVTPTRAALRCAALGSIRSCECDIRFSTTDQVNCSQPVATTADEVLHNEHQESAQAR
jgi:hypothetical protein